MSAVLKSSNLKLDGSDGVPGVDWGLEARRLLKSLLAREGITYREVATRMQSAGFDETERSIANKIARGKFSFAFVLEVASVLGWESVTFDVSVFSARPSQPRSRRLSKAVPE